MQTSKKLIDNPLVFTINHTTYVNLDVQNLMAYKKLDNKGLAILRNGIKEEDSAYTGVITKLKLLASPSQIKRILKKNPELLEFLI